MSTEQHLNKLFETARHAEPLLSAEDIELQLKVKGIHTPKRFKLFNRKIVLFMSAFIILLFALFFWLPQDHTEKISKPQIEIEKTSDKNVKSEKLIQAKSEIINSIPDPIKHIPISGHTTSPLASQDHAIFASQYQKLYNDSLANGVSETISAKKANLDSNITRILLQKKLVLTAQELSALGFKITSKTITYENKYAPNAYLGINVEDGQNFSVYYWGWARIFRKWKHASYPFHPLFATGSTLGISLLLDDYVNPVEVQELKSKGRTEILFSRKMDQLIPVEINLPKAANGPLLYVFWFEPTPEFLAALPKNKLQFLVDKKTKLNNSLNTDREITQTLTQKKLMLSEPELKQLGFKTQSTYLNYENNYAPGRYMSIYARQVKDHVRYYWDSIEQRHVKYHYDSITFAKEPRFTKLPFFPLFLTSLTFDVERQHHWIGPPPMISANSEFEFVRLLPNEYPIPNELQKLNPKDRDLILFNRMNEKLIPIQIFVRMPKSTWETEIFWFEPTPEFLAALPKDQLTHTNVEAPAKVEQTAKAESKTPIDIDRSIDLRKIKLIELSHDELKKFGIFVSEKAINVTTIIKSGNLPLTIAYSKEGSSLNAKIRDDAPDSGYFPQQLIIKAPAISFQDIPPSDTHRDSARYIPTEVKISVAGLDQNISFSKRKKDRSWVDSLVRYPSFSLITDDLGQKWRMYEMDDSISGKEGERKLIEKIGGYIPILVRSGDINDKDDDKNNLWRADIIIWYEPSELLFNTLPPRISNELRAEYQSIFVQKESNGANCKYFEACKNKPGAIVSYNIFPNPTDDDLQIEFILSNARLISANLYTVNGQLVKSILNQKNYESGSNKHASHINDLAPGIYLLVIESDKGDIISQRIVRK